MIRRAPRFLPETEAIQLITSYDILYPEHRFAASADEAVAGANAIGYPVVLKAVSVDVIHKSDVGGVVMQLQGPDDVRTAFEEVQSSILGRHPNAVLAGMLICRQETEGVDVIIGGFRDATFGPMVMFGLGGVFTEILNDVAFRVAPVDFDEALGLVQDIRGRSLLEGARGRPSCDIPGLASAIISVSRLMIEHAEISSLDINPIRAFSDRVVALDVRVEIAHSVG